MAFAKGEILSRASTSSAAAQSLGGCLSQPRVRRARAEILPPAISGAPVLKRRRLAGAALPRFCLWRNPLAVFCGYGIFETALAGFDVGRRSGDQFRYPQLP